MDLHSSSSDLSLKDSGFVDPDSECNHCSPASNLEMLSDLPADNFNAGDTVRSVTNKTQHQMETRGDNVDPRGDSSLGYSSVSTPRSEIPTNISNQKASSGFLRTSNESVTRTLSLHRRDFVTNVSRREVHESHWPADGHTAGQPVTDSDRSSIGSASCYVVEASVSETSEMIFGTVVCTNVKGDQVDFCGAAKAAELLSMQDKVDANTSSGSCRGSSIGSTDASQKLQSECASALCNCHRRDSKSQEDLTTSKKHTSLRSAFSLTLQGQTDCYSFPQRTSTSDVVITSSSVSSSIQSHRRSVTVRQKSSAGGVSVPGDAEQQTAMKTVRSVENLDRFLSRSMNHDDSIVSSRTVVVKQELSDLVLHHRKNSSTTRVSESCHVPCRTDNLYGVLGQPKLSTMSPSVAQKPLLLAEDDLLMATEKPNQYDDK